MGEQEDIENYINRLESIEKRLKKTIEEIDSKDNKHGSLIYCRDVLQKILDRT